jgi:hypothetical protein
MGDSMRSVFKAVLAGFNRKYGLNPETISRGRYALTYSADKPFDDVERALLERYNHDVYAHAMLIGEVLDGLLHEQPRHLRLRGTRDQLSLGELVSCRFRCRVAPLFLGSDLNDAARDSRRAVDFAEQPIPDPAMFGLPADDDGPRNDPLLGQNMISCTHHEHDFDALRAASTRIVIGVGADSDGEMANRAAVAVAERLGTTPVSFPSDHGGFLGGEYGQTGDPEAFAGALRQGLTGKDRTAIPGASAGSTGVVT